MIELLSIDVSNYCSKQCDFCYNHSSKEGNCLWLQEELVSFAVDCVKNGIKAISLGGGEPFEYDGIFEIIDKLQPIVYLSITTNGLPLENKKVWENLLQHKPNKIHITIHHPENDTEVERVFKRIESISNIDIKAGLNLLVANDKIEECKNVYCKMRNILTPDQIILVPQRFSKTPLPKELAYIVGNEPFQSPSCLLQCKRPDNFVSVSWNKMVNSCSYAEGKEKLLSLDYKGLVEALQKVVFSSCKKIDINEKSFPQKYN